MWRAKFIYWASLLLNDVKSDIPQGSSDFKGIVFWGICRYLEFIL